MSPITVSIGTCTVYVLFFYSVRRTFWTWHWHSNARTQWMQ